MIYILEHSLLEHFLTVIKNQPTPSHFRYCWSKISEIVASLVSKDFPLEETFDEDGNFLGYKYTDTCSFVSIFPYGVRLAQAFANLVPNSSLGFIGYAFEGGKKEKLEETLCILPENVSNTKVLICSAAVNSGLTVKNAISRLQIENVAEVKIVTIFARTEGIENIRAEFPEVPIYVCSLEGSEEMEKLSFLELYLRNYNL
jgi:uracil phosphoribosyltransferase